MIKNKVIPVILCGGSGTRLWPLSRETYPKQYLKINSSDNYTQLQKTQKRISVFPNIGDSILVCNEEHRFIAAEQMREIGIERNTILLEPFSRNTAPAITLASLIALEKEEDPILLILSSDHEIKNNEKFIEAIKAGISLAENNRLVTFGVIPTSPETGYGYIKSEKELNDDFNHSNILNFIEKPTKQKAKEFLEDKRFSWNSGIFLFKAKTILNQIKEFSPDILDCCKEAVSKIKIDLGFQRLDEDVFKKCPNTSVDVAVMEKTNLGTVVPLNVGWSDIGSWDAVWENSKKNKYGNSIEGDAIIKDSHNCFFKSQERLIAGVGLNNLMVIDTNDALLISDKDHAQKVKNIVGELKEKNFPQSKIHTKVFRPWGNYETLVKNDRWQVKLIMVKPGEKLSLQMHHHRSEHWVVVSGTAKVQVDENILFIGENESTYIPLGKKHRLANPGKIPLLLIEVQSGSYVGEDDIVRFEDKYGR